MLVINFEQFNFERIHIFTSVIVRMVKLPRVVLIEVVRNRENNVFLRFCAYH